MTRNEILEQLDQAIARRSPVLEKQLVTGLPTATILRRLKKLTGNFDPVIDWYGWHNGAESVRTEKDGIHKMSCADLALTPGNNVYCMTDIDLALAHFGSWQHVAKFNAKISEVVGRFFPLLWDGSTGWLAVCVEPTERLGRVVLIEFESDETVEVAYKSFDEFLLDAVHANNAGESLQCLT